MVIVITKHGRPVAQLAPVSAGPQSLFGYMKDTMKVVGDITAPIEVAWSAESGDEDQLYDAGIAKPRRKKSERARRRGG